MSRLYAWITSDTGRGGKQEKTITGNKMLQIRVNFGSSSNSQRCCYLHVDFQKDEKKPTVYFSEVA